MNLHKLHLEELKALKYDYEFRLAILRKSDIISSRITSCLQVLRDNVYAIERELTKRKINAINSKEHMQQYIELELQDYNIPAYVLERIVKNIVFKTNQLPEQIQSGDYIPPNKRKIGLKYTCKQKLIDFIYKL